MERAIEKILISTMPRSGTVFFSKFISLLFEYKLIEPSFTSGFRPIPPDWDPYKFDKSYLNLDKGSVLTAHYQLDSGVMNFISSKNVLPIYLYRDPRDAAVSATLYIKYALSHHVLHKYFSTLSDRDAIEFYIAGGRIDAEYLPDDMDRKNGTCIYHDGMSYFTINAINWLSFPNIVAIKYEDFFKDPFSLIKSLQCNGPSISHRDIDRVLAIHNFKTITGRDTGIEDKTSHFRKGISGDYLNYFDDRLHDLVAKRIGAHIKFLGYY
jgi:hypothetical protein